MQNRVGIALELVY